MAFTDKIVQLGKNRSSQFARTVVMEVGARLVERSPVGNPDLWLSLGASFDIKTRKQIGGASAPPGYVGGHFRANWQHGFNAAPSGELDKTDKSGSETKAKIQADVLMKPASGVHYIVNNLPYADALENGHSSQAPNAPIAIVGLTLMEIPGIMDEAARK